MINISTDETFNFALQFLGFIKKIALCNEMLSNSCDDVDVVRHFGCGKSWRMVRQA